MKITLNNGTQVTINSFTEQSRTGPDNIKTKGIIIYVGENKDFEELEEIFSEENVKHFEITTNFSATPIVYDISNFKVSINIFITNEQITRAVDINF